MKKWTNDELSKMIKFIGTYFHFMNQAELDEIIFINLKEIKYLLIKVLRLIV